ncbi:hypothetical protein ABZ585_07830 [Streptomyces vietnamensis]
MPEAGSKGRGTVDGPFGKPGDRLSGRNLPGSLQRRPPVIPALHAPEKSSADREAEENGWPGKVLEEVVATRYVTPLREGGSLPGIVEADDLGTYVMKLSTCWR